MKKRRIRHVSETKYCIEGIAKFDDCKEEISEFICAYWPDQAFKRLALKLERERGQTVYLGDCDIYNMGRLPPDYLNSLPIELIYKKKKREEQLELFKIHRDI